MAVDDRGLIDIMSFDKDNGQVVLTISDHLDWSDSLNHQLVLQEKFNSYLAFVESGELHERYPDATDRTIVFRVVFRYKPDKEGRIFLDRARRVIESAGFKFHYELFADSHDN